MKKRIMMTVLACILFGSMISGCGGTNKTADATASVEKEAEPAKASEEASKEVSEEPSEEASQEVSEEVAEEEGGVVGIANPWVDITEAEAKEIIPRLFKLPEGATDLGWMKCEELGDPEKGISPLVQLSFTLEGDPFTARAQVGVGEDADIAGNYLEWTVGPEDATLANWGGGNMKGKTYRSINDTGYVDQITWYDMEIGISYSLSVAAADLDGFDIQGVAEAMYDPANEPSTGPEDFLQEQSGKTSFDTYEDVIAALKKGKGYAYIKLMGSEEDILAVTDLVFEADHTACQASLYGKRDGKVKGLGLVDGNGSAYPLRLSDGILYGGDNHSYFTYFLSKDNEGLMYKDSIEDGVNYGTDEIVGFTRDTNDFESKDFEGGKEEFDKLLSEREKKPAIEFTVVENE